MPSLCPCHSIVHATLCVCVRARISHVHVRMRMERERESEREETGERERSDRARSGPSPTAPESLTASREAGAKPPGRGNHPPSSGEVSSGPDVRVGQSRVDPRRYETPPYYCSQRTSREREYSRVGTDQRTGDPTDRYERHRTPTQLPAHRAPSHFPNDKRCSLGHSSQETPRMN